MIKTLIPFALIALLAACGDDDEVLPDDTTADAAPAVDADPNAPDGSLTARAFALGTDYTSVAVLSSVDLPSLVVSQNIAAAVAQPDPVVRSFGGLLYIINRAVGDNITIFDPKTNQLVRQLTTGAGSNPHDVAVVGDALYVCAFGVGEIIKLDLATSPPTRTTIDISALDSDDNPNCDSIYAVDGRLFATLGVLDDAFAPRGVGKVVVIDTSDDSIETNFDLSTENPVGFLVEGSDGALYVPTVVYPDFGDPTGEFAGCVQRIDTSATPSASCFIQNADLGGGPNALAFAGDAMWVAVTTSTSFDASELVQVGSDGMVADTAATGAEMPTDIAVCPTGQLVVSDGTFGAAGIRVYDGDGTEQTTAPLDIGLPPVFTNGIVCL